MSSSDETRPALHTYFEPSILNGRPINYNPPENIDDNFTWLEPMDPIIWQRYEIHIQDREYNTIHDNLRVLERKIPEITGVPDLKLPESFRMFFKDDELPKRVPSVKANYFGIYPDELIVCPSDFAGENECILIRFWTDQQGSYFWYLCLDKTGRHCVIGSDLHGPLRELFYESEEEEEEAEFTEDEDDDDDDDDDDDNDQKAADSAKRDDFFLSKGKYAVGTTKDGVFMLAEGTKELFNMWAHNFTEFIFIMWAGNTSMYKHYQELPMTQRDNQYYRRYKHMWEFRIPGLHNDTDEEEDDEEEDGGSDGGDQAPRAAFSPDDGDDGDDNQLGGASGGADEDTHKYKRPRTTR